MECPVCHYKNIPSGTKECPNCHSDLEAFHLISDLEKTCKKRRIINLILGITAAFLLGLWIGTYFYMLNKSKNITDNVVEAEFRIEQLTTEKQNLLNENENLLGQIKQLQTTVAERKPEPRVIHHTIKWGETLFSIAMKYYGDGHIYGKIACDNNITDPDLIIEGRMLYIYVCR